MSNLEFQANFQEKLPSPFIYLLWLKSVNIKPAFTGESPHILRINIRKIPSSLITIVE